MGRIDPRIDNRDDNPSPGTDAMRLDDVKVSKVPLLRPNRVGICGTYRDRSAKDDSNCAYA
jgi:hypothetical protein